MKQTEVQIKPKSKGKRRIGWMILLGILACIAVCIGVYAYRNLHPAVDGYRANAFAAGYVEQDATMQDGSVIHYAEGPNNGPALLLIHGQGGDWAHYGDTLPALAKNFHVFSVDCYGHGGSTHDPALYNCAVNSKALVEFLTSVVGEPAYLSGHSSGGIMASWIAANAPQLAKGLVIEDSPLFEVLPEEMSEGAGCAAWFDSFLLRHNYLNQTQEPDFAIYYAQNSYFMKFFGNAQQSIVNAVRANRATHAGDRVRIGFLPGLLTEGMYLPNFDMRFSDTFYTGSWFDGMDQAETLAKIVCPTIYIKALVQYGKDGVLYAANSDEDAQRVMSLIPNCEMMTIKSGHNIHCEHPDFFVKALNRILEETK